MNEDAKQKFAAAHAANPAVIAKRRAARANYVVSPGQVLNPDESDFRRPAVTPEEAKEIEKQIAAAKHPHKSH